MKLRTSQILAQLSEQERSKAEIKLAELQSRKHQLEQQQQNSINRIMQLNQQRDQAMRTRNAASLLAVFDISVREQQANISAIHELLEQLEEVKQLLLADLMQAHKKERTYDKMHDKEQRLQSGKQSLESQRQLDDMAATRISQVTA